MPYLSLLLAVLRAIVRRRTALVLENAALRQQLIVLCRSAIGTLRRECTDHLLALNDRHLERLLREFVTPYNSTRTHVSLERNAPLPRAPAAMPATELRAVAVLGGLHHRYEAAA
jgi:hypothetical protein